MPDEDGMYSNFNCLSTRDSRGGSCLITGLLPSLTCNSDVMYALRVDRGKA